MTHGEHLALTDGMARQVADISAEEFFHLARTCLIKDERNIAARAMQELVR